MGSFADGDVEGFSMTVPNCAKAVGVSSSIGMRMDGAGIEGGILTAGRSKSGRQQLRWVGGVGMEIACGSLSKGATDAIAVRPSQARYLGASACDN